MRAFINRMTLIAILAVGFATAASAQDAMMKDGNMSDSMMMSKRPIVAIIRADWCPACKKLEPVMKEIADSYGDKIEFVILDITNEMTTADAMKIAEKYGIGKFFEENKKKSSTVAIFKQKKLQFTSHYKSDAAIFTDEIDKALGN